MGEKTIFINYTNENEIKTIVKHMKIKSRGVHCINTKVLKLIIDCIVKPLTYLFNNRIDKAVQFDALKKAKIVPISKAKEKSKAENYRPISLTSNSKNSDST